MSGSCSETLEDGCWPLQADPAKAQVFAFRQNVVYIADAASGRVVQTIPFEFEKS